MRRLSGGGAVYHDMGNVNFRFLAKEGLYDVDKQLSVLIKAAVSFGIKIGKSGRNDLTVKERKVSGNAFFHIGKNRCHHGTILLNACFDHMGKYLHTTGG